MVHLFTQRNILHTIFYAVFTFFLAPFVFVEKTKLINPTFFAGISQFKTADEYANYLKSIGWRKNQPCNS